MRIFPVTKVSIITLLHPLPYLLLIGLLKYIPCKGRDFTLEKGEIDILLSIKRHYIFAYSASRYLYAYINIMSRILIENYF